MCLCINDFVTGPSVCGKKKHGGRCRPDARACERDRLRPISTSANFDLGQFRLGPISTSANFDFGQFSDVEFYDHKGWKKWGPEGWRPKPGKRGPEGWAKGGARRVEPEGWGAQNFAFFFPLPPQFSFFSPSLGGPIVAGDGPAMLHMKAC